MNKKEITAKLDEFCNNLEMALSDESIFTIGKALVKLRDDFGNFVQGLEDELEEERDKEEEMENPNG